MWVWLLGIAVAVVALSYWIGFSVLSQVLEEHGFYPGDDGKFHHVDDEEEETPVFTYCLRNAVCEAFRVGDIAVPDWAATSPEVDVVVSKPPRVVLHKPDGTTVKAQDGDYIMLFDDNHVGIIQAKDLDEHFVKVQLQEESV